jgi:exosortase/archaeosortase family protein
VSAAVAIVVQRSVWERVVILASAVPIALLANIVRITLTGVLYEIASPEFADRFFHDLGGWLMGPMALLFLWLELRFLDQSMISVSARPLAIGR